MTKQYTAQVYKDAAEEWRWRLVAKNGNIVAVGGEGYKNRSEVVERINDITTCGSTLLFEDL